ncbi:MAG: NAD(P)-binding domain-containing protein [Polyangiaceae bacterium]
MNTKIAIIGAGNVGGGLARSFSRAGFEVLLGVRAGKDLGALLGECGPKVTVHTPLEATQQADVVFFAVPGGAAVATAAELAEALAGKVAVDCNNAVVWKEGPVWNPPAAGSLTQAMSEAAPKANWVKGWNTFGAEFHAEPLRAGERTQVFLASDHADAKQLLASLGERAGFQSIDAGPLRNAPVLENLAILWIHLATVGGKGRAFTLGLR